MAFPTDRLPGGAWTYALPAGLLSLPLTVLGYARTGSELALAPVVVCGLCAGYLARRETGTTDGVGTRTGALGALAVSLPLADMLASLTAVPNPPLLAAGFALFALGGAGVLAAVVVLGALAVARVGGRLAGRSGGAPRRAGAHSQ